MPAFIAALLGGLINIIGTLAGRVLVALGIGVVTYSGVNASLDFLKSQAISGLSALPADLVGIIAFMKVGVCINILFSAYLARLALDGMTSGTFKRWVLK